MSGHERPPSPAPFGNDSGPARCLQLTGEGEVVHGLRILRIDLQGAAQIVESPRAVSLLAEDGANVLEGHGFLGFAAKSAWYTT
jgi:hypothetical protein